MTENGAVFSLVSCQTSLGNVLVFSFIWCFLEFCDYSEHNI